MTRWQQLVVMKSLPAEYRALRSLSADVAGSLTPLIQLWDRAPTSEVEEEGEEPDEPEAQSDSLFGQQPIWDDGPGQRVWKRLRNGLVTKRAGAWPKDRPILLDGDWLPDPAEFGVVLGNARADGFHVLPVTGVTRPADYQAAVAELASSDRGGLVIRLRPDDFAGEPAVLGERLESLLASVGFEASSCDLVLDLGSLDAEFPERDELNAESMIRVLPQRGNWRNLAIAGSGTPKDVSGFNRDDITPFRRLEWRMWLELRVRRGSIGRLPIYGDYGVIYPERIESIAAAKQLPRIPKLLWATRDEMFMIRGHDLRTGVDDGGLADLAERLKDTGDWPGPNYSEGDAWFDRVARGQDGPGNWGTWKWAGQVHVLTHTSRQLASLPDL